MVVAQTESVDHERRDHVAPAVIRRRVTVSGRVQGVGFRASCRTVAERLGVDGTVRNLSDGTVEVDAAGDADAVEQLVDWCRNGPRQAHVSSVQFHDVNDDDPDDIADDTAGTTFAPGFRIVH